MIHVDLPPNFVMAGLAAAGVIAGVVVLVRGFAGYRSAGQISGTSVSRIASLAVGEVLVSGVAEPVELTLISPLQSKSCVYYRSRIEESRDDDTRDLFREDRAVGFRIRDASGAVRVFPSGARFDVPTTYDESSSSWTGGPIGYQPRIGSAYAPVEGDHEARVAALLTVRRPGEAGLLGTSGLPLGSSQGRRHYTEALIEPGAIVTVLGRVLPFADLDDPVSANLMDSSAVGASDPEVAADLAEARAAGLLAASPEEAWGNAAIPGFGIGKPIRAPELDPEADLPPPPDPVLAARAAAAFEIAPDALILATSDEVPMLISLGAPAAAAARAQWQFILGMGGAVFAIASAMALAIVVQGGLR